MQRAKANEPLPAVITPASPTKRKQSDVTPGQKQKSAKTK
jgi:hypothetical protein